MLASILIIAVSLVLLVYWFRYTCILLLRNAEPELAPDIDAGLAHGSLLAGAEPGRSDDPLLQALERDYRFLTYVLRHAASLECSPVERRLLSADFRLMRFWYRLARTAFPEQARSALLEMSSVVRVLSHRAGARSGMSANA